MKNVNLKARIKRNKLDVIAGECFRNEDSEIIKSFNLANKKAFLGIQKNDGIYTILGDKSAYFSINSGEEKEIYFKNLLNLLSSNALQNGKFFEYEFLKVSENEAIWVKDIQTMNALWNTILLLVDNN